MRELGCEHGRQAGQACPHCLGINSMTNYKPKEAREFWIPLNNNGVPTHIAWHENPINLTIGDFTGVVHVIEYHAYSQVCAEIKALDDQCKGMAMENIDLSMKCKKYEEATKEINKALMDCEWLKKEALE